jgi:hypothetical protein
MKRTLIFLFLGLAALLWGETVINGSRSILGSWDASSAVSTIPAKVGTTAPATCTVGEQFFDSDATAGENIMLCTATNTWTAVTGGGGGSVAETCLPGDLRYNCVAEEFVGRGTSSGQIGALGWSSEGTVSLISGEWPYLGLYRFTTGATSGNRAGGYLNTTNTPYFGVYANTTSVWDTKFVFRLGSATDTSFILGFGDRATLNISQGVGLRSDAGNFAVQWGAGGSPQGTPASTGVALDTNWHTFRIYTDGTSQKIYTSFDNGIPITLCPIGCTITVTAGASIWTSSAHAMPYFVVQTDTTAAKSMDIDYWSFKGTVGTTEHVR